MSASFFKDVGENAVAKATASDLLRKAEYDIASLKPAIDKLSSTPAKYKDAFGVFVNSDLPRAQDLFEGNAATLKV